MKLKKWKIGLIVAVVFGLLTAGSGLVAGMQWQAFVAVLCTSLVTQLAAYLMKHPVEEIED
jgi:flagellar motor component MotA